MFIIIAQNSWLINLLSELYLNLTEGNVQLPEVVRQHTKKYRSLVRALARKKKG